MNARELRKLSRLELLEMLLDMETENKALKEKISGLEAQLSDRTLRISKAGSIAEAAFMINGIFETAEATCAQYLENIRRLNENQDEIIAKREADSQLKTQALLEQTTSRCRQMEEETKEKCDAMLADAQQRVDEKWKQISKRLTELYANHEGLLDLVNFGLSQVPRRGEQDAEKQNESARD